MFNSQRNFPATQSLRLSQSMGPAYHLGGSTIPLPNSQSPLGGDMRDSVSEFSPGRLYRPGESDSATTQMSMGVTSHILIWLSCIWVALPGIRKRTSYCCIRMRKRTSERGARSRWMVLPTLQCAFTLGARRSSWLHSARTASLPLNFTRSVRSLPRLLLSVGRQFPLLRE